MQGTLRGFAVLTFFFASGFAAASTIAVNGVCYQGNCSSPDNVPAGTNTETPFTLNYTEPNSDQYVLSGNALVVSAPGGYTLFTPLSVQYVGNASGTASQLDSLSIVLQQGFINPYNEAFTNGYEAVSGNFNGSFGSGTQLTFQLTSDNGTRYPLLGPFRPDNGPVFEQSLMNLSGVDRAPAQSIILTFNFTIGAGSMPGSSIDTQNAPASATITPEPATFLLGVLGLLFYCVSSLRRLWIGILRQQRLSHRLL
jgi:hypothetical protein